MDRDRDVVRSPKMRERRRMVRREHIRRRRRITVAVALAASTAAGVLLLSGSAVFAVTAVEVTGVERLSPSAVIDASGLEPGARALTADLHAAAERIEELPDVLRATVARDGLAVTIAVVERRPALAIVAGSTWVVDRSGRVLDDEATRRLPVVALVDRPYVRGPRPPVDREVLAGIHDVHRSIPTAGRTDRYELGDDGSLRFRWGTVEVSFGRVRHIAAKVEAVRLVRAHARRAPGRLVAVDVRVPDRPAAIIR